MLSHLKLGEEVTGFCYDFKSGRWSYQLVLNLGLRPKFTDLDSEPCRMLDQQFAECLRMEEFKCKPGDGGSRLRFGGKNEGNLRFTLATPSRIRKILREHFKHPEGFYLFELVVLSRDYEEELSSLVRLPAGIEKGSVFQLCDGIFTLYHNFRCGKFLCTLKVETHGAFGKSHMETLCDSHLHNDHLVNVATVYICTLSEQTVAGILRDTNGCVHVNLMPTVSEFNRTHWGILWVRETLPAEILN